MIQTHGAMDDVQHLLEHGKEESYLFLCDSRLRDLDVFPTPSEYEVTFASPFRNVFSIDLIDATVPRTEYNIDAGRNTLTYALAHPLTATADDVNFLAAVRTATVDPGDYTLPHLVEALNTALGSVAEARGDAYALAVQPASNPTDISNKVRFTCGKEFTLLMATSGLRSILGFGDPVKSSTVSAIDRTYANAPQWSSTLTTGAGLFLSVHTDTGTQRTLESPVPVMAAEGVYPGRTLRQYFVCETSGAPLTVTMYVKRVSGSSNEELTVRVVTTPSGPSLPALVVAQGTAVWKDNFLQDQEVWEAEMTAEGTAEVLEGSEYFIEIVAASGSEASHLGVMRARANILLPGGGRRGDVRTYDGTTETSIPEIDEDLCISLDVGSSRHHMVSPGLVNLTGEPYVLVRCPEVEQFMYRDRAYERYHAGLGMVKLATYGYADQRFDFVSFPPRRFHARGKFPKLTIRIEKPDGSLYNARGVDHTLLIVLRYYTEKNDTERAPSMLNPRYMPELHRYLPEQKWAEEEDEEYFRPWR